MRPLAREHEYSFRDWQSKPFLTKDSKSKYTHLAHFATARRWWAGSSAQLPSDAVDSRRIRTWHLPNSVIRRGCWEVKPRLSVKTDERAWAAGYRNHPTVNPFVRITVLWAKSISILKIPRLR